MTKKLLLFIAYSLSFLSVYSYAESDFRIRPYVFIPQESLYRDIYGKAGGGIQLEAETDVYEHLQVWANIDGLFKKGNSIGFCSPTKIGIANFSFGLKTYWDFWCSYSVYLGVGPTLAGVFVHDDSFGCITKARKFSAGVVGKFGFHYFWNECYFVDLFADYLYQPVHFQRHVNVGGAKIGLGFGYAF